MLPTIKELIMYANKALDGIAWNTNLQKIVNWLTSGKYQIKVKNLEISQGGGITNNGSLTQNGDLTVTGDLEVGSLKANGIIEGDGSKLYNLQTQGVQAFTPFTVNSGNLNNGNADLIQANAVTEGGVITKFTIDFLVFSSCPVPNCWAVIIPPPLPSPLHREKNKNDTELVAPTAANASAPTNFPTITESTRLYIC